MNNRSQLRKEKKDGSVGDKKWILFNLKTEEDNIVMPKSPVSNITTF